MVIHPYYNGYTPIIMVSYTLIVIYPMYGQLNGKLVINIFLYGYPSDNPLSSPQGVENPGDNPLMLWLITISPHNWMDWYGKITKICVRPLYKTI